MAKPESGFDFSFLLISCNRDGNGRLSDEIYVINKVPNGSKDPILDGEILQGQFTKRQKQKLEALLTTVLSPGFRS